MTLGVVLGGLACRQSAGDRAEAIAAREREAMRVAATDVVRAAASPPETGRVIYERPTDLSYASARLTRSDLVRSDSGRR
jgi:hypothetical protein